MPDKRSAQVLPRIATPAQPSSGFDKLYTKSSDGLYLLDSSGIERRNSSADVLGVNASRRVDSLLVFEQLGSSIPGSLIIQTNIVHTPGVNIMAKIRVHGYDYASSSVIDLDIGFYAYGDGPGFYNNNAVNRGTFRSPQVRLGRLTADNRVVIIIDSPTGTWEYPKIAVDGVLGQQTVPTATVLGWTATISSSVSAYTGLVSVPVSSAAFSNEFLFTKDGSSNYFFPAGVYAGSNVVATNGVFESNGGVRVYSPNNIPAVSALSGLVSEAQLPVRLKAAASAGSYGDANTLTESGFYYFTNAANGPAGVADGMVYVSAYSTSYVTQLFMPFHNQTVWTRHRDNGTWNAWTQVLTSEHFGTSNTWSAQQHFHGGLDLNGSPLYLLHGDANHGLSYNSGVNGPRLWGYQGGELGWRQDTDASYTRQLHWQAGQGLYGPRSRFGVSADSGVAERSAPLARYALEAELTYQSIIGIGESDPGSANPAIDMLRTWDGYRGGQGWRMTTDGGDLVFSKIATPSNAGYGTFNQNTFMGRFDSGGNLMPYGGVFESNGAVRVWSPNNNPGINALSGKVDESHIPDRLRADVMGLVGVNLNDLDSTGAWAVDPTCTNRPPEATGNWLMLRYWGDTNNGIQEVIDWTQGVSGGRWVRMQIGSGSWGSWTRVLSTRDEMDVRYLTKSGVEARNLRMTENISGGGTVSFDGTNLKWSQRFIIMPMHTNAYLDLTMPAAGVVLGALGNTVSSANTTVTANGINMASWMALYFRLSTNSFYIGTYNTGPWTVSDDYVLIASHNADTNYVRLANGMQLAAGQSLNSYSPYQKDLGAGTTAQYLRGDRTWQALTFGTVAGAIDNTQLPARLQAQGNGSPGADWNNAIDTGWYSGNGVANAPEGLGGWFQVRVHQLAGNSTYVWQEAARGSVDNADRRVWVRYNSAGTWSSWQVAYDSRAAYDLRFAAAVHNHNASDLNAGVLNLARLGSGMPGGNNGSIVVKTATDLTTIPSGSPGQFLRSNGSGNVPIWVDSSQVDLTSDQTITGYKRFQGGIGLENQYLFMRASKDVNHKIYYSATRDGITIAGYSGGSLDYGTDGIGGTAAALEWTTAKVKVNKPLDVSSQKINNLANPSVASDAANKAYVDGTVGARLSFKLTATSVGQTITHSIFNSYCLIQFVYENPSVSTNTRTPVEIDWSQNYSTGVISIPATTVAYPTQAITMIAIAI